VLIHRLLAAATCLTIGGCGGTGHTASEIRIPHAVLRQARPIGRGPLFHAPARGRIVGACQHRLGPRYGVHLEVFGSDRVVIVPAGIGTRPPRRYSAGRIFAAGCFGALVTREPTGLVLVRNGHTYSVGDLFRAWGQPLSAHRVAGFHVPRRQQVRVYVDGRRWPGAPGSVPLRRHAEIVLEVGPFVPPHRFYTFPPGT
jgi:hypothetical protein